MPALVLMRTEFKVISSYSYVAFYLLILYNNVVLSVFFIRTVRDSRDCRFQTQILGFIGHYSFTRKWPPSGFVGIGEIRDA